MRPYFEQMDPIGGPMADSQKKSTKGNVDDIKKVEKQVAEAVEAVKKLASDIHLPGFNSLGVKEKDLEELAVNAFRNGSNIDNPRPMKKEDYLNLFQLLIG